MHTLASRTRSSNFHSTKETGAPGALSKSRDVTVRGSGHPRALSPGSLAQDRTLNAFRSDHLESGDEPKSRGATDNDRGHRDIMSQQMAVRRGARGRANAPKSAHFVGTHRPLNAAAAEIEST